MGASSVDVSIKFDIDVGQGKKRLAQLAADASRAETSFEKMTQAIAKVGKANTGLSNVNRALLGMASNASKAQDQLRTIDRVLSGSGDKYFVSRQKQMDMLKQSLIQYNQALANSDQKAAQLAQEQMTAYFNAYTAGNKKRLTLRNEEFLYGKDQTIYDDKGNAHVNHIGGLAINGRDQKENAKTILRLVQQMNKQKAAQTEALRKIDPNAQDWVYSPDSMINFIKSLRNAVTKSRMDIAAIFGEQSDFVNQLFQQDLEKTFEGYSQKSGQYFKEAQKKYGVRAKMPEFQYHGQGISRSRRTDSLSRNMGKTDNPYALRASSAKEAGAMAKQAYLQSQGLKDAKKAEQQVRKELSDFIRAYEEKSDLYDQLDPEEDRTEVKKLQQWFKSQRENRIRAVENMQKLKALVKINTGSGLKGDDLDLQNYLKDYIIGDTTGFAWTAAGDKERAEYQKQMFKRQTAARNQWEAKTAMLKGKQKVPGQKQAELAFYKLQKDRQRQKQAGYEVPDDIVTKQTEQRITSIQQAWAKTRKQVSGTADASQKVMYHWGNLVDITDSRKTHQLGGQMAAYIQGQRNGGVAFADGTGAYTTTDVSQFAGPGVKLDSDPLRRINKLDVSKLNLFEETVQQRADAFYNFQHMLERYAMSQANPDFHAFDEELKVLTSDANKTPQQQLFERAKAVMSNYSGVFDAAFANVEEFTSWLSQMTNLVKATGMDENGKPNPQMLSAVKQKYGVDDIKTRFMKQLGFQGINLQGTTYDSLRSGNVVYDINNPKITRKRFESLDDAQQDAGIETERSKRTKAEEQKKKAEQQARKAEEQKKKAEQEKKQEEESRRKAEESQKKAQQEQKKGQTKQKTEQEKKPQKAPTTKPSEKKPEETKKGLDATGESAKKAGQNVDDLNNKLKVTKEEALGIISQLGGSAKSSLRNAQDKVVEQFLKNGKFALSDENKANVQYNTWKNTAQEIGKAQQKGITKDYIQSLIDSGTLSPKMLDSAKLALQAYVEIEKQGSAAAQAYADAENNLNKKIQAKKLVKQKDLPKQKKPQQKPQQQSPQSQEEHVSQKELDQGPPVLQGYVEPKNKGKKLNFKGSQRERALRLIQNKIKAADWTLQQLNNWADQVNAILDSEPYATAGKFEAISNAKQNEVQGRFKTKDELLDYWKKEKVDNTPKSNAKPEDIFNKDAKDFGIIRQLMLQGVKAEEIFTAKSGPLSSSQTYWKYIKDTYGDIVGTMNQVTQLRSKFDSSKGTGQIAKAMKQRGDMQSAKKQHAKDLREYNRRKAQKKTKTKTKTKSSTSTSSDGTTTRNETKTQGETGEGQGAGPRIDPSQFQQQFSAVISAIAEQIKTAIPAASKVAVDAIQQQFTELAASIQKSVSQVSSSLEALTKIGTADGASSTITTLSSQLTDLLNTIQQFKEAGKITIQFEPKTIKDSIDNLDALNKGLNTGTIPNLKMRSNSGDLPNNQHYDFVNIFEQKFKDMYAAYSAQDYDPRRVEQLQSQVEKTIVAMMQNDSRATENYFSDQYKYLMHDLVPQNNTMLRDILNYLPDSIMQGYRKTQQSEAQQKALQQIQNNPHLNGQNKTDMYNIRDKLKAAINNMGKNGFWNSLDYTEFANDAIENWINKGLPLSQMNLNGLIQGQSSDIQDIFRERMPILLQQISKGYTPSFTHDNVLGNTFDEIEEFLGFALPDMKDILDNEGIKGASSEQYKILMSDASKLIEGMFATDADRANKYFSNNEWIPEKMPIQDQDHLLKLVKNLQSSMLLNEPSNSSPVAQSKQTSQLRNTNTPNIAQGTINEIQEIINAFQNMSSSITSQIGSIGEVATSTINDIKQSLTTIGLLNQSKFSYAMSNWAQSDKAIFKSRGKDDSRDLKGAYQRGAFVNTKTGEITNPFYYDQLDGFDPVMDPNFIDNIKSGKYNGGVHSHPQRILKDPFHEWQRDVIGNRIKGYTNKRTGEVFNSIPRYTTIGEDLIPSDADINSWLKEWKLGIVHDFIESNGKMLHFDFSKLENDKPMREAFNRYKEYTNIFQGKNSNWWEYIRDKGGFDENNYTLDFSILSSKYHEMLQQAFTEVFDEKYGGKYGSASDIISVEDIPEIGSNTSVLEQFSSAVITLTNNIERLISVLTELKGTSDIQIDIGGKSLDMAIATLDDAKTKLSQTLHEWNQVDDIQAKHRGDKKNVPQDYQSKIIRKATDERFAFVNTKTGQISHTSMYDQPTVTTPDIIKALSETVDIDQYNGTVHTHPKYGTLNTEALDLKRHKASIADVLRPQRYNFSAGDVTDLANKMLKDKATYNPNLSKTLVESGGILNQLDFQPLANFPKVIRKISQRYQALEKSMTYDQVDKKVGAWNKGKYDYGKVAQFWDSSLKQIISEQIAAHNQRAAKSKHFNTPITATADDILKHGTIDDMLGSSMITQQEAVISLSGSLRQLVAILKQAKANGEVDIKVNSDGVDQAVDKLGRASGVEYGGLAASTRGSRLSGRLRGTTSDNQSKQQRKKNIEEYLQKLDNEYSSGLIAPQDNNSDIVNDLKRKISQKISEFIKKYGEDALDELDIGGGKDFKSDATLKAYKDALERRKKKSKPKQQQTTQGDAQPDTQQQKSKKQKTKKEKIDATPLTRASKVIEAYQPKRAALQAKAEAGVLTSSEAKDLQRINQQLDIAAQKIKQYNQARGQSAKLTQAESKAQQRINDAITQGKSVHEKQAKKNQQLSKSLKNDPLIQQTNDQLKAIADRNIEGLDLSTYQTKLNDYNIQRASGALSELDYIKKTQAQLNKIRRVEAVVAPGTDAETARRMMVQSIINQAARKGQTISEKDISWSEKTAKNGALTGKAKATIVNSTGQDEVLMRQYDATLGYITKADTTLKKHQTTFEKFTSMYKNKLLELGTYLGSFVSFYEVWGAIKEGVNTVKQFDTALTEMRKVSDESIGTLQSFQTESFGIADSVGTTALQIQQSTADFMRLGQSLDQAKKSAANASLLLNVSEFDSIDDATTSLIAMTQAFDDYSQTEILDSLNKVGNEFSISTQGLSVALQKSASALKTEGNDLAESIALLTAGNQVVQDPQSVGAAMKVISLRLAGQKQALKEQGEDVEDMVQTTSKLQEGIMNATRVASNNFQGIDIEDQNGNLRSTYDIILDIARVWQEIGKNDLANGTNRQAYLLQTMAGKMRSNVLASVLQSPDVLQSSYQAAQNSEGSAEAENQKFLQSIEGRQQVFQNKLQEVTTTLLDSSIVKWVVDSGSAVLGFIDSLVSGIGSVGTAITGLVAGKGVASFFKNFDTLAALGTKAGTEKDILKQLLLGKAEGSDIGEVFADVVGKGLVDATNETSLKDAEPLFKKIFGDEETSNLFNPLMENYEEFKEALADDGGIIQNIKSKLADLKNALVGVAKGAIAHPLITAGVVGVTALIAGITAYNRYKQAMIDTANTATSNWNNSKSSLQEYISQYTQLKMQLESGDLSEQEQIGVKQQILDLQKQIVQQYGAQASGIDLVNGKLSEQINQLNAISQNEAIRNIAENNSAYEDAMDEMQKQRTYTLFSGYDELNDTQIKAQVDKILGKYQGFVKDYDPAKVTGGVSGFQLMDFKGTASEAHKTFTSIIADLNGIKNVSADQAPILQSLISQANKAAEEASGTLNDYQANYDAFVEQTMYANGGGNKITGLSSAISNYNTALLGSDQEAIDKARQNYREAEVQMSNFLGELMNSGKVVPQMNQGLLEFFASMQEELNKTQLQYHDFTEMLSDTMSGEQFDEGNMYASRFDEALQKVAKDVNKMDLDEVDIKQMWDIQGTNEQQDAVRSLAEAFGLTKDLWGSGTAQAESKLRSFINALVQAGLITGQVAAQAATAQEELGSVWDDQNLSDIQSATEQKELGDNYDAYVKNLKRAKELRESGDVGTKEFKALAKSFSPSGSTGYQNFDQNVGDADSWFSGDETKDITNFLTEMQQAGLAVKDESGEWSIGITDLGEAAAKTVRPVEQIVAMLGLLNDKGFNVTAYGSAEQAMTGLKDKTVELHDAEEQLAYMRKLQAEGYGDYTLAIEQQEQYVDKLRDQVETTTDMIPELAKKQAEGAKEQAKIAKEYINQMYEQYKKVESDQSIDDETKGSILRNMQQEIEDYAKQNNLTLDITGETLTVDENNSYIQKVKDAIDAQRRGNEKQVNKLAEQLASAEYAATQEGKQSILGKLGFDLQGVDTQNTQAIAAAIKSQIGDVATFFKENGLTSDVQNLSSDITSNASDNAASIVAAIYATAEFKGYDKNKKQKENIKDYYNKEDSSADNIHALEPGYKTEAERKLQKRQKQIEDYYNQQNANIHGLEKSKERYEKKKTAKDRIQANRAQQADSEMAGFDAGSKNRALNEAEKRRQERLIAEQEAKHYNQENIPEAVKDYVHEEGISNVNSLIDAIADHQKPYSQGEAQKEIERPELPTGFNADWIGDRYESPNKSASQIYGLTTYQQWVNSLSKEQIEELNKNTPGETALSETQIQADTVSVQANGDIQTDQTPITEVEAQQSEKTGSADTSQYLTFEDVDRALYGDIQPTAEVVAQVMEAWGIPTDQTQFGNIDLNNRQIVPFDDGSYATVLGGSGEWGGRSIAYSPIDQRENGKPYVLSDDQLNSYMQGIIANAIRDHGEGFSTEDLLASDKEGYTLENGEKIDNLIAAVSDAQNWQQPAVIGQLMHFLGTNGALNGVLNNQQQNQQQNQQLQQTSVQTDQSVSARAVVTDVEAQTDVSVPITGQMKTVQNEVTQTPEVQVNGVMGQVNPGDGFTATPTVKVNTETQGEDQIQKMREEASGGVSVTASVKGNAQTRLAAIKKDKDEISGSSANITSNVSGNAESTTSSILSNIQRIQSLGNVQNTITTRKIQITEKRSSGPTSTAIGTMYAPAHADGTVGLANNQNALVNQEGTESVVRNGRWFQLPGGPHIEHLKRGDIVFSKKQTEQLKKTGKTNGHGSTIGLSAHAAGTVSGMPAHAHQIGTGAGAGNAAAKGKLVSAPSSNTQSSSTAADTKATNDNTNSKKSNTNATDKNTKSKEEEGTVVDWVAKRLDYLGNIVSNLAAKITDYISYAFRQNTLDQQLAALQKQIGDTAAGIARYNKAASEITILDNDGVSVELYPVDGKSDNKTKKTTKKKKKKSKAIGGRIFSGGKALVNEQGMESRSRNGVWELLQGGPHFEDVRPDDIIFTADQTEDLLRKGKTQNYAPAFKKGKSSKKKKKSTKNKNSSKKMTKKQQNQQAAIDKYKSMIDQGYIIDLSVINDSQVATAVQNYMDYKDKVAELESQMIELENKWVDVWAEKTTAPSDEAVNRIDAYTKALGGLTDQMNALEASTTGGSTLAALDAIRGNKGRNYNVSGNDVLNAIRTGNAQKTAGAQYTLDRRRQAMQRAQGILSQFTAQYGARAESDNSKQGQAYRAILKQVQQAEEEYTNAALELAKQRVQEIKDNIDAIEDMYGAMSDWQSAVNGLRQSYINLNKARGNYENYTDYLVQAANAQKVLAIQQQESARLHNEYVQAIAKGTLKQGTKEWYEMRAQILKVDQSIQDSKADIEELNKSARKAKLEQLYERAIEKADEFIDRIEIISSLISEEMKVNIDTGDLTDFGKLSIAMDNQSMINAERDLNMYLKQREQIVARMRAQGAGDQEINDYIAQNTSNLSNAISALQSARNSILSTIKSQAKAELDALQKTIDKRKEALQKKKDYYDYDKNQKKSVKEIALLQSQVRALQNVTDAQSKMRKARLEAQLQEQQEDLEQTRKEHVYQLQVEGLDDLSTQLSENYDKYVNELETNLDKMTQIINDAVEGTARSVTGVYNAMTSLLGEYGISGNDLKTVFGFSGDVVGSARDVISNPNGGYTQTTSQIISSEQSRAQNAKSSAQKASNQQQAAEQAKIAQRQKQLAEEARKRAEEEARRKAEEARRAAEEEAARRKRAQLDANIASVQQNLANHQNALNQLLQAEKALEIKASKTKKKKKINQMMKQMEANMKQITAYQQAIQTIQTQLSQLQAARGYASGVRRVNQDQTAWTNENWQKNGGQIIVRKSDGAILTPLKAGDGVIPADMTQKLFGLAQNYGSIMGGMDYSNVRPINQNQNITVTYGSLLTVNGNVDEKALPGLQEILRKSYAYTVKNLSADLKKGGLRTSIH